MTFSAILRIIRNELGLTQEQLAHELNISFSTLNRWGNGHTSPSRLAKIHLKEYCHTKSIASSIVSELENL